MTEASGTTGEDARHILDIAAAADRLDVDPATGLTHDEATHRLDRRGPNRLAVAATRSPWLLLLDQFRHLLTVVLMCAAVVAGMIRTGCQ